MVDITAIDIIVCCSSGDDTAVVNILYLAIFPFLIGVASTAVVFIVVVVYTTRVDLMYIIQSLKPENYISKLASKN